MPRLVEMEVPRAVEVPRIAEVELLRMVGLVVPRTVEVPWIAEVELLRTVEVEVPRMIPGTCCPGLEVREAATAAARAASSLLIPLSCLSSLEVTGPRNAILEYGHRRAVARSLSREFPCVS